MNAYMDGNMIFIMGDSFTDMGESDDYIILDPKDLNPRALREIECYMEGTDDPNKMWEETIYGRNHPIRKEIKW